jgi:tetratricopeptide (TPR) repeat protein
METRHWPTSVDRQKTFAHGIALGLCAVACAAPTGAAGSKSTVSSVEQGRPNPRPVVLARTIVSPQEALTLDELLERARWHLARGEAAIAAREFSRVAELDREGRLAPQALLEASAAEEAAGNFRASVEELERLAKRFPGTPLGDEALVRTVRLCCFLEKWESAGTAADALLVPSRKLAPIQRIVAYGGKALALLHEGKVERAEAYVDRGRAVVLAERLDAAGRIPRDLAQLYFALGEIRRAGAERIRFQPFPADFPRALEDRCQRLLDAQSAYSDAMRAHDAHWSAMAGYRVGELYQRLHEDLMAVEPPPTANTEARRQLFEASMRLRYSVLLDKARSMMQHIRTMAASTAEDSHWVREAEAAEGVILRAQREEREALRRLPYTRAELEQELERQAELSRQQRRSSPERSTDKHPADR